MIENFFRKILGKYLYKSAYSRAYFGLTGLVFKELRMLYAQFFSIKYPFFSLFHILGVLWSSLSRFLLGRNVKYSFAFTGEDRIIESILKKSITYSGIYVDVGCNHPKFLSNTYSLYRKGWKGVCIDPNPFLIDLHRKYRPNDTSICSLISDQETDNTFYFVENNVLSTMAFSIADEYKKEGLLVNEKSIRSQKLTSVLDSLNFPVEFDLLTIDAEDHDFEVLSSLDFSKYSPTLVVVEDDTFDLENLDLNRFCVFMKLKGYRLHAFVLDNLYFIKTTRI